MGTIRFGQYRKTHILGFFPVLPAKMTETQKHFLLGIKFGIGCNVGFSQKNLSKHQEGKKMEKTVFLWKSPYFGLEAKRGHSAALCGPRPNFLGQKHLKMMPGIDFEILGILGSENFLNEFLPFYRAMHLRLTIFQLLLLALFSIIIVKL